MQFRRIFSFIILFLISHFSQAKNKFLSIDHVELGLNISGGRIYKAGYFNDNEFRLSYSAGVPVVLLNAKSFGLTTGIQYTRINQQSKKVYFEYDLSQVHYVSNTPPEPRPIVPTIIKGDYMHQAILNIIDVPLIINFFIVTKELSFSINAGVIANYYINQTDKYITTDNGRIYTYENTY